MIVIDLIITLLLIYGFIKGLYKGFIKEVASVIGLFLGIYLAIKFNSDLSVCLSDKGFLDWNEDSIIILSHIVLFTLSILLVSILGKIATKLVKLVALGIFNKILGSLFGLLKNVLILFIVIFIFNLINNSFEVIKQSKLELSFYYNPFNKLSEIISTHFF
ncbi:CvpA family protein [Flavobacteriaceae bacterium]|nr:CvpA family protein [Flavobacteriaceae bacterium]MDC1492109.1 CvpA family protein [Flavobacteriaceae bacterium]MDC1534939.1 CvpA family protein [Flavobacteriaceae bacterium]